MGAVRISNSDLAKLQKKAKRPDLEGQLWAQLVAAGLAKHFVRQYAFSPDRPTWDYRKVALPGDRKPKWQWVKIEKRRQWKFDFACVELKLAIEVNGASFAAGRHNRGVGAARDNVKLSEAAIDGWTVVIADGNAIRDGVALDLIRLAFSRPKSAPAQLRMAV